MTLLEPFLLIILLTFLFYKWATLKFNTFKERGVPHAAPKLLFGNLSFDMLLGKTSFCQYIVDLHTKKFKNSKVYGFYSMREPFIVIRDNELIKKVLVQDFQYFANHKIPYEATELEMRRNLVVLKDREWKEMRDILTPTFTSNKMRLMFELMNECCIEGIEYLHEKLKEGRNQELELEMADIFSRFSNDVIASAALGIKVVSFRQKANCFFTIGTANFNFGGLAMLKATLVELMPTLMKLLGVRIFNREKLQYFSNLVLSAMKYREQHHILRPDMISLLMHARKQQQISGLSNPTKTVGKQLQMNDSDVVAQCMLFYFAGFGKVSLCLSFTAHELLENLDVQERLYQEIIAAQRKLGGKPLDYDTLVNDMQYMDMVIYESLRKWPVTVITDRTCSQDYNLTDADGNLIVKIRKNDDIWISFIGMHHDPENFENPEKFDPERFSEQNKRNIKPCTYLPFGMGPRNCLGFRFAMLETKMILYHIVLNFKILPGLKTPPNLLDSIHGYHIAPDTFWMKLLPR